MKTTIIEFRLSLLTKGSLAKMAGSSNVYMVTRDDQAGRRNLVCITGDERVLGTVFVELNIDTNKIYPFHGTITLETEES